MTSRMTFHSKSLMGSAIQNIDVLCKPSVYLLYDKGTLVYVGQSMTPESRVLQHRGSKTFDSFKILRCRPDRRKYWEDVLMSKFKPKYNKSTNNGSRTPVKKKRDPIRNSVCRWHTNGSGFSVWSTSSDLILPRGDCSGVGGTLFGGRNSVVFNKPKGVGYEFEEAARQLEQREKERKKKEGR